MRLTLTILILLAASPSYGDKATIPYYKLAYAQSGVLPSGYVVYVHGDDGISTAGGTTSLVNRVAGGPDIDLNIGSAVQPTEETTNGLACVALVGYGSANYFTIDPAIQFTNGWTSVDVIYRESAGERTGSYSESPNKVPYYIHTDNNAYIGYAATWAGATLSAVTNTGWMIVTAASDGNSSIVRVNGNVVASNSVSWTSGQFARLMNYDAGSLFRRSIAWPRRLSDAEILGIEESFGDELP